MQTFTEKDHQVKLRGLRIELGEIEKCLTGIEGIRSAVVVIKKVGHEDGICAYYTAEGNPDVEYLKSELKKSLTDYMIPVSFNQLDELPTTPNGKVNINALGNPMISDKPEAGGLVKPKTATEKDFCEIFADILNLDEVSATDSFFDLGGTSLTVTRVVIAANKLNYNITYGDVFANPTPSSLAKLADGTGDADDGILRFDDYNYENINRLLEKNTIGAFINGEKQEIGDVILTGATGFLGVHILRELFVNYNGNVCCLMRGKGKMTADQRLRSLFFYFFEEDITDQYGERLTIIDGDITNKNDFEKLKGIKADTFINCAANVKHFSKGTDIEDVNYHGVQNIVAFCEETGTRLVHVSTMSVGGMFLDRPGAVTNLKENMLYYGQVQSSKYTGAKFLAERAVLESAANGLNAKIMRVGNLSARESDGEYQINFTTNSFMGRLKSTYLIGCYPYETMDMPFEFSPIDYVAKAILLLTQSPRECIVFHPYNNHALLLNDLYSEMNRQGLTINPAENSEYETALRKAESDSKKAQVLSSIIAYENISHGRKSYEVGKSNEMTMQALYRMGFRWPVTSFEYMKKFLVNLKGLEYFEW